MNKRENPDLRERLRGFGADSLSDVELVALVLGHGRRGEPLQILAGRLLWETGGLKAMTGREARELERIRGIGPATAARLEAALELGRRLCRPALEVGEPLHCANDAARHFHGLLSGLQREEFHCLMLDSRHKVLGSRLVSVGSLQSSIVHPREVFRPAIRQSAATLVVAHNHPSGDPSP
ncbi:MAG: RadC family protein, partial [Planctomycetota bacterium]